MPLGLKLLKTHTLTFYRPSSGYYSGGVWVDGVPTEIPDVKGSLQPFREARDQQLLPEGVRTEDARFFYTKTVLLGSSEFTDKEPDYTTIGGRVFEVHTIEDWNSYGLSTDHNKYILIARAQNVEGGE